MSTPENTVRVSAAQSIPRERYTNSESMPDGTLLMEDPLLGPGRWVEIGDGLVRKVDDAIVLAFKGDRGGKAAYLVGRRETEVEVLAQQQAQ